MFRKKLYHIQLVCCFVGCKLLNFFFYNHHKVYPKNYRKIYNHKVTATKP